MGDVVNITRKMPSQGVTGSRQDYATPKVFLDAVRAKFKIDSFDFDLAADGLNRVTENYFGSGSPLAENAFSVSWSSWSAGAHLWLNPPFSDIAPWAKKCFESTRVGGARIYFLSPASVGSNWYAQYVHKKARVYFLNGRISFDGKNPYPKDLMLSVFGLPPGFRVWRWNDKKTIA